MSCSSYPWELKTAQESFNWNVSDGVANQSFHDCPIQIPNYQLAQIPGEL